VPSCSLVREIVGLVDADADSRVDAFGVCEPRYAPQALAHLTDLHTGELGCVGGGYVDVPVIGELVVCGVAWDVAAGLLGVPADEVKPGSGLVAVVVVLEREVGRGVGDVV
jgi:hypothetical protein